MCVMDSALLWICLLHNQKQLMLIKWNFSLQFLMEKDKETGLCLCLCLEICMDKNLNPVNKPSSTLMGQIDNQTPCCLVHI